MPTTLSSPVPLEKSVSSDCFRARPWAVPTAVEFVLLSAGAARTGGGLMTTLRTERASSVHPLQTATTAATAATTANTAATTATATANTIAAATATTTATATATAA